MRPFYYVGFGILALGLLLLILNHSAGSTFGLSNENFADIVMLTSLAAVIGAMALRRGQSMNHMLRNGLIWAAIILVLVTIYRFRFDLQALLGIS